MLGASRHYYSGYRDQNVCRVPGAVCVLLYVQLCERRTTLAYTILSCIMASRNIGLDYPGYHPSSDSPRLSY